MKELSIEEKAKAYDEAIINGSRLWECDIITRESYEFIFPELRESDDERVKKALIKHFKECQKGADCDEIICGLTYYDILDWLEKQGKDDMGISESTKQELEDNLNKALEKETAESYNEFLDGQESADKTEPKFKVGDWIVSNVSHEDYRICKILNIENGEYAIESIYGYQGHNSFETFEKDYHLWTIQDAKDGDILASKDGDDILIFKNVEGNISFSSYYNIAGRGEHCWLKSVFIPATKKQRDLLFSKMNEAGYEWDAEKKELKKMEQKQSFDIEIPFGAKDSELQEAIYYIPKGFHAEIDDDKVVIKKGEKPIAWGEDIQRWIDTIIKDYEEWYDVNKDRKATIQAKINILKSLKNRVQPQPKQEWSEEDEHTLSKLLSLLLTNHPEMWAMFGNWLKSLKEKVEVTTTDSFIEKARKWFEMQNEGVDSDGNYKCDMTDWECFKSYMKGE